MSNAAQTGLLPAREVARSTPLSAAANGLRWASYGFTEVPSDSLLHIVQAVPPAAAAALRRRAYYFVPLAIGEMGEAGETEIAPGYTLDLSDRATCHRNVLIDGVESTFISARLMQDKFALAFEFFINIGHQFVDAGPVPQRFQDLVWAQAKGDVRGETSQDAWEARKRALDAAVLTPGSAFAGTLHAAGLPQELSPPPQIANPSGNLADHIDHIDRIDLSRPGAPRLAPETWGLTPAKSAGEQAGSANMHTTGDLATAFFEATFADTLAIYMLSLSLDLDYADLREREYPLLAAPALADRLRLAADLFPPDEGYEFAIKYRRRH